MGCTQSKIDNEEAVSRCKNRKQIMQDAVATRNAFAAAHFAYTVALKNTGAALSDYGQGEVQLQDDLHFPLEKPPPAPRFHPQVPIQRAASAPPELSNKSEPDPSDTIHEEDGEAEIDDEGAAGRAVDEEAQPPPPPPENNPDPPPPPPAARNVALEYMNSIFLPEQYSGDSNEIRPYNDEDGSVACEGSAVVNSDGGSMVEHQTPEKVIQREVKLEKTKQIIPSQTALADGRRWGKAANDNLLKILNNLDEEFLKASQSAHEVSKLLEANRLHYHSNFADNRGYIDHSAMVMSVILWDGSFKNKSKANDGKDKSEDQGEKETHATVLDKLLAWEKKLYDEVKAGELMKLEYQRKVALLNKQKKRSTNPEALEKTKAAVSHLHNRYIVDMQSLDSVVEEINRLRDEELYPKLVELVNGMANMWETMHKHHESQKKIVDYYLKILDTSQAPKETSKHHQERTGQLWMVLQEWNSQFQKLVTHQKHYIRALSSWLKLNLIPIESSLKERVSSPPRIHQHPIEVLLLAWNDHLEKLPDALASTHISNFAAIVRTVMKLQQEEVKLKENCEETSKELKRKSQAFEDWHAKYKQRRTPPEEMDPESTEDPNYKNPVAERQFVVESLKKRLEEDVEAHEKFCKQVREKSLVSLKMHLPELFRAMSDFASSCSKMYKDLSSVPNPENPTEG